MLEKIIQYPFIVFPFGSATPALIITILYMCVLIGIILYGKKKNTLQISLLPKRNIQQLDIIKLFISIVGFIILVFSCIFLSEFLADDNPIIFLSNVYLNFEIVLFGGTFLFLSSSILNKTNKDKQISVVNEILHCLIWVSIGTGLLTKQIDYTLWQNKIVLSGAFVLIVLYRVICIESNFASSENANQFNSIPYTPVQNIEELFPQHKTQATDIANIIYNSSSEPFSICVSGEWGTGKTSVVNGVIDILKKYKNCYEFIYINALELDNKQAMVQYLFSQIKEKLKSRGVYVGIDSEFKDFISSSAGSVTSGSIGTFIHKKLFHKNDDYRFQKEQLEKVLHQAFGKGKLIVIIDDIERCEKTLAREYLFLLKEVATMEHCVSIFITDYTMLSNLVSVHENKPTSNSSDFLSKFFNYRIDLKDESPEDILSFYDNYLEENNKSFQSSYNITDTSPAMWYQNVIFGISTKLNQEKNNREKYHFQKEQEEMYDNIIKELEEKLVLFCKLMKNSRNVVKFYNVFRNNVATCNKLLFSSNNDNETKNYIYTRNVGEILYVLSFTEIFLPIEYQRLIDRGAKYAEQPPYGKNETVSKERALLIEITQGLVYWGYYDYKNQNSLIKHDIRNFIDAFISNKNNLPKLVNSYSSQEEKWIIAINESDASQIKDHWTEMVLTVLQTNPDSNTTIKSDWHNQMFDKLLSFAEQQIEIGAWTSDKVFSIFESDMNIDRWFAIRIGVLASFWKHLNSSTLYKKPSKKLINDISFFACHYTYERMGYIYRLAHYLISYESQEKTKKLQEKMLNINNGFTNNISSFLDELAEYLPNFSLTSKTWYDKYKDIAQEIIEYLTQNNISKYIDVEREIEFMIDSLDEIKSLEYIVDWMKNADKNTLSFSLDSENNNIDEIISYFVQAFGCDSQNVTREIERQFLNFFQWLENNQNVVISKKEIEKLHELVTAYVTLYGYSSLPYRRTLLNISIRQSETKSGTEQ